MIRHLIIKRKEGYFIFEARCCNNIVRALSIVFYFTLKTNEKCSGRIQLISIKKVFDRAVLNSVSWKQEQLKTFFFVEVNRILLARGLTLAISA